MLRAEPAWPREDLFTLLVARGKTRKTLRQATLLGPFDAAELTARMDAEAQALRGEGFLPGGLEARIQALQGTPRERALAAVRLGWRRDPAAVEPLLQAFSTAGFERSAVLDALGLIGDGRALSVARAEAEKKLLSRRRSGVEALRNLDDSEGLVVARGRALDRLPDELRLALEAPAATAESVAAVLLALPVKEKGLALDSLYELGTPLAASTVIAALPKLELAAPHVWRYVKSVLKRSLLRRDAPVFGAVGHAIERAARKTPGTQAELKSGLDGSVRKTAVFRRLTQIYVMRLSWRHLRDLARYEPGRYAEAAAEVLARYGPEDTTEPTAIAGSLSTCHLLHRILLGRSERFELERSALLHRFRGKKPSVAKKGVREESYPELWDASPGAYIRLLAAGRLREVHEFALTAVKRAHRSAVEAAAAADIVAFLSAPHEETVELGLIELNRRFDPRAPDLELLQALAKDGRPAVREQTLRWLELAAPVWTRNVERTLALLDSKDGLLREAVANLAVAELPEAGAELRQALAERIARLLVAKETEPGQHDGLARVASLALLEELTPLISLDDLIVLFATGSSGARSVAGALLGRHPEALDAIGLSRLAALGSHEVASLRESVRALLLSALPALRLDPSPLFALVESEWPDARTFALDLLRSELAPSLGRAVALGFLDSRRPEVQRLGRDLLYRDVLTLAAHEFEEIVDRLVQHPDRTVHAVALELLLLAPESERTLRPELMPLLRGTLFDLTPQRSTKRGVLALLRSAALRDEASARLAAPLLSDFVGTKGRLDFEETIATLVEIRLAYPGLESRLHLVEGPTA